MLRPLTPACCAAVALGATACVGPGLLTDGTSVSFGTHGNGVLRDGALLPFVGEGYLVPDRWKARRRNFGTDELVRLVRRTASRVQRVHRRSQLGVADLSPRGGGPTPEHGSHRSGRDVDLIYYSVDEHRRPLPPTEMVRFGADRRGRPARDGGPAKAAATKPATPDTLPTERPSADGQPGAEPAIDPTSRYLDVARNWSMIRALLTDAEVPIQWIFMARRIQRILLRYARRKRVHPALIARAAAVLRQPHDGGVHDDHIHVRIFCPVSDRHLGCIDRGPPRWMKKHIKYLDQPSPHPPLPPGLRPLRLGPMRFPWL